MARVSGDTPLKQIEALLASPVQQDRSSKHPNCEIRPFCTETDYIVLDRMIDESEHLSTVCDRARGDEMNANGLFWRCPNCFGYTVPGQKKKGGTYAPKNCPHCELKLDMNNIEKLFAVSNSKTQSYKEPYVSGVELTHRYQIPKRKWLRTDFSPVTPKFKNHDLYQPPKVLIRQAGVGMTATISYDWDRCPQSVYLYRCTEEARTKGYSEEYILAAIASRTMNYYLFKRFPGELKLNLSVMLYYRYL